MKKLLQTLTETFGPSGYEDKVREVVRNEVQSLADEIRVDTLGNLIAHKHLRKNAKDAKKIMIAAHMDEIGVMASHVDKNGFVRFSPIGNVLRRYVPGGRVCFLNGTRGVIACDHLENVNDLPTLDKIYIDVGATSPKDCPVKIGDVAAFDRPYTEYGDRLVAKSMGGRVGVLIAIETLRSLKSVPYDVYFVFTTQSEVGARGAATSAYGIDPDIGIALDVTPAGDTPNSQRVGIALGKGPCIKIQDAGMIADTRIVNWMVHAAQKSKIPHQSEVLLMEDSDASRIQRTRAGVPSGCISVPVRYIHSPSEMVDYSDVQTAVKLLTAVLHTPLGG
ncbi:MAG TPA: M20/M25/M40 family metallo-hydrolase [Anaerolineales bacterium]|nr:M20/M25/M40 family metallo-hydrolase [Anaerolineales bacterium]